MSPMTKRRIVNFVIELSIYVFFAYKTGVWVLLIFSFGLWAFYDGRTRGQLSGKAKQ
jgi:hypothetical protein